MYSFRYVCVCGVYKLFVIDGEKLIEVRGSTMERVEEGEQYK